MTAAGTTSFCGNRNVDEANGEECDDGNDDNFDACTNDCLDNSLCGNNQIDPGEDCDGLANETNFCGANCQCDVTFGNAMYGENCARASDCASGFCVPNPLNGGVPQCTRGCDAANRCPGVDRCLTVATTPDVCLSAAHRRTAGGLTTVCLPNETGAFCRNGGDCRIEGLCVSPPNPMPNFVPVQSACASGCDGNADCPTGYRCDVVRNQLGLFVDACIPDVQDVIACPGTATVDAILASVAACQNVCPFGDRIACYQPIDGIESGFCSCKCGDADDCPRGFSCAKNLADTGDLALPGVCTPVSGYRCPDNAVTCLSSRCLSDDDWPGAGYCSSECVQNLDCPTGYRCRAQNNDARAYCEPE